MHLALILLLDTVNDKTLLCSCFNGHFKHLCLMFGVLTGLMP